MAAKYPPRDLNPEELTWFDAANSRLTRSFNFGKAQNTYEQKLQGQSYDWDKGDLLKQFGKMRENVAQPYVRRGMINSGMHQKGLTDWATEKRDALGRLQTSNNYKGQGFDMAQGQLNEALFSGRGDLNAQRAARRKMTVSNIQKYWS